MALTINGEGNDVAKYVAARGVTAFVLKYRLARTGEDGTQEFNEMLKDGQKLREMSGKTVPLAVADGLAAVTYVRQHASEWGVSLRPRGHHRILRWWSGHCRSRLPLPA
jgi:hypothetical protein